MPLARYFLYVGGVLLALLLISDAYLPKLAMPESAATDWPMIRISSDRKWPERVVFDTSGPTVAAVETVKANAPAVAEMPAKLRVREAYAQIPVSEPGPVEATDQPKPRVRPQQKRRVGRKRPAAAMQLVARQPQFSFFANSTW